MIDDLLFFSWHSCAHFVLVADQLAFDKYGGHVIEALFKHGNARQRTMIALRLHPVTEDLKTVEW